MGSSEGVPSRSKHFYRRYWALKQRIQAGECELKHVPDTDMPADFLTKWLPDSKKLERSLSYATGNTGPDPRANHVTACPRDTRSGPTCQHAIACHCADAIGGSVGSKPAPVSVWAGNLGRVRQRASARARVT